jgi:hypothetical protein
MYALSYSKLRYEFIRQCTDKQRKKDNKNREKSFLSRTRFIFLYFKCNSGNLGARSKIAYSKLYYSFDGETSRLNNTVIRKSFFSQVLGKDMAVESKHGVRSYNEYYVFWRQKCMNYSDVEF